MKEDDNKVHSTTSRVLKALGIFGGVQVASIICSVIRTKLAALWIGPAGVGLMAVYNSTLELMTQTSQLSLNQSTVPDLAKTRHDSVAGPATVGAVRKLIRSLGLIAFALMLVFSPLMSRWAFGDTTHIVAFCVLSLVMIFNGFTNSEATIMRGYDRLKELARMAICTSVATVLTAVPLFYFFRIKAVVPVLLFSYGYNSLFALIFRPKDIKAAKTGLEQAWRENKSMLSLGMYMTVSTFVSLLASNIFVIYLNRCYTDTAVGIYQAGYTLINTYVGMIFMALSMEFYPRLSAARERSRMEVIVSHEIKIAMWVLMPVVVGFICCGKLALDILYSDKFYGALPFIIIGGAGVLFRAASNCIAYTILAKGSGRLYIITETASAVSYLALYIPLFNRFGYMGLGIGYVLWYAFYYAVVYYIYRKRFGMRLRKGISALIATAFGVALLAVAGTYTIGGWWTLAILLPPTTYAALKGLRG